MKKGNNLFISLSTNKKIAKIILYGQHILKFNTTCKKRQIWGNVHASKNTLQLIPKLVDQRIDNTEFSKTKNINKTQKNQKKNF